jgi:hypothetical protein
MSMLQTIKRYSWVVLLAASLVAAWGFGQIGPTGNAGDAYQTAVISYPLPGDVGSPKNIGEGYRRNTPVMVYAANANFLTYFGSNGLAAVDGAFTILNTLTNVSSYSPSLSEFPLYSQHANFTAQSLFLTDLKSVILGDVVEQLGLVDPVPYIWTLRARTTTTTCPILNSYVVVQRNLETTPTPLNQVQFSPYVNGTLYTYSIFENCTGPNPLAGTIVTPVDPFALASSPVAALPGTFIDPGYFYTGLTRDDVAGLRYLMNSNNITTESSAAGSVQLLTNTSPQLLVTTLPFDAFAAAATTNTPAQMLALYPGLVIVSSNAYFTNILTPIVVTSFQNVVGAPVGSPPKVVTVTNGFTPNFFQFFTYVFGNLYTNSYSSNSFLTTTTVTVQSPIGSPVGTPGVTNTSKPTKTLANLPGGDFFIIPTTWCGYKIVQTLGTQVVVTTNSSVTLSNAVSGTNSFSGTQTTTTIFTNHTFVIEPLTCTAAADTATQRRGIERIQFVKANFDSLLTQLFQPITNLYSMATVSNSQPQIRYYRRVITTPDFLFTATDLGQTPVVTRNMNFFTNNTLPGLAGPGSINPTTTTDITKTAPTFVNVATISPSPELSTVTFFAWGSFDSSTNDPVVYPDGTSIANLQNQILVEITPQTLPDGTNNLAYSTTTFTATGGSFLPPFTWSVLAPSVLPQGLTLSSGGAISGTPVNNPVGTYDFVIQMTDSQFRTVNWSYSINISQ